MLHYGLGRTRLLFTLLFGYSDLLINSIKWIFNLFIRFLQFHWFCLVFRFFDFLINSSKRIATIIPSGLFHWEWELWNQLGLLHDGQFSFLLSGDVNDFNRTKRHSFWRCIKIDFLWSLRLWCLSHILGCLYRLNFDQVRLDFHIPVVSAQFLILIFTHRFVPLSALKGKRCRATHHVVGK